MHSEPASECNGILRQPFVPASIASLLLDAGGQNASFFAHEQANLQVEKAGPKDSNVR